MAKSTGIIKINGLLDGKVFYRRNGKDIIQSPGGFNGDRIKSESRYEKTRQLNSEFGDCARQASVLKTLLHPFLCVIPDSYIYNWMQTMLVKLKNHDAISASGSRNASTALQTEAGQKLLGTFQFNRNCALNSVLTAPFFANLETGSLTILKDSKPVRFPKGTHYAAIQFVLLRMDFDTPSAVLEVSENYILTKQLAIEEDLVLNAMLPKGNGVLMGLVSVRFLNLFGEEFVFVKDVRNVLGIMGIGI